MKIQLAILTQMGDSAFRRPFPVQNMSSFLFVKSSGRRKELTGGRLLHVIFFSEEMIYITKTG
jgi:hypothetical protein